MWGTRTLGRARRRLAGRNRITAVPPEKAADLHPPSSADSAPSETTVSLALTRPDKDRFASALATRLGSEARLDTPERVASGLTAAIEQVGGRGRSFVVRSPAGLYTPEYWHISVQGADGLARAEVERLAAHRRTEQ